jgi:hypothetical protein
MAVGVCVALFLKQPPDQPKRDDNAAVAAALH